MWPSPQPRADPPSALTATRFPAGSLPRPPTVTEEAEQANKERREESRPSSCPRHHHGRHFAKGLAPWGEGEFAARGPDTAMEPRSPRRSAGRQQRLTKVAEGLRGQTQRRGGQRGDPRRREVTPTPGGKGRLCHRGPKLGAILREAQQRLPGEAGATEAPRLLPAMPPGRGEAPWVTLPRSLPPVSLRPPFGHRQRAVSGQGGLGRVVSGEGEGGQGSRCIS